MIDLSAIVARFGALLVPGWEVTLTRLPPEKMPIKGALAVCDPTPTRELLRLYIVDPWPEHEDLAETIAHEMTHGMISPLTALLGNNPHAIMTEERIVERLGKALAKLPTGQARAMARAVQKYAPQLRARLKISAPPMRARDGGNMDGSMIKKAIAALKEGNGDAALAMLEEMVVAEASEGEPDGDEASMAAKMPEGDGGAAGAGAPPMEARMVARMKRDRAEMDAILKDQRSAGKTLLIEGLRARLGSLPGLPAIEKRINAAPDYLAAKQIADIAIELAPTDGAQRARSGVSAASAPASASGQGIEPPHTLDELVKEGIHPQLAGEIISGFKTEPDMAIAQLAGARARLATKASPWATAATPNSQKVS